MKIQGVWEENRQAAAIKSPKEGETQTRQPGLSGQPLGSLFNFLPVTQRELSNPSTLEAEAEETRGSRLGQVRQLEGEMLSC